MEYEHLTNVIHTRPEFEFLQVMLPKRITYGEYKVLQAEKEKKEEDKKGIELWKTLEKPGTSGIARKRSAKTESKSDDNKKMKGETSSGSHGSEESLVTPHVTDDSDSTPQTTDDSESPPHLIGDAQMPLHVTGDSSAALLTAGFPPYITGERPHSSQISAQLPSGSLRRRRGSVGRYSTQRIPHITADGIPFHVTADYPHGVAAVPHISTVSDDSSTTDDMLVDVPRVPSISSTQSRRRVRGSGHNIPHPRYTDDTNNPSAVRNIYPVTTEAVSVPFIIHRLNGGISRPTSSQHVLHVVADVHHVATGRDYHSRPRQPSRPVIHQIIPDDAILVVPDSDEETN